MKKSNSRSIILFMQLVASISCVAVVYTLNMLPVKYMGGVIIILMLLWLYMVYATKDKKGTHRKRKLFSRIVSLLISISLMSGVLACLKVHDTMNKVTNVATQTYTYTVLVKRNSSYYELSDLVDTNIGYCLEAEGKEVLETLDEIKETVNISTVESESYEELLTALYDERVSSIIMCETQRSKLETLDNDLGVNTRELWSYQIEQEVEDFSKAADITQEAFNIYVTGIDTYGPVSTVSRSDVNLVLTVNPNTNEILITSIPRDYYVPMASTGYEDKLTHAGNRGVQESVATIENLLDIDINYYLRLNFTSVINIVDALGGITVYSPYEFYTRHDKYLITVGDNYLNGKETLGFVRERYALPNGDFDRGKNQQRAIEAIFKKAISPTLIVKYSSILDSISGSFETNLKSSEIQALIKMQINDMESWSFSTAQTEGTNGFSTTIMPGYNISIINPDYESVAAISQQIKELQAKEVQE